MRNPVGAVQQLNNPTFRHGMNFAPERAYTNVDRQSRVFDAMWTGDAWWRVQVRTSCRFPISCCVHCLNVGAASGGIDCGPDYFGFR